jgi:hypothetical protein
MAISDVLKKKIGKELREWLFLGVRTGARRGVNNYRQLVATGRMVEAELAIKRVIDLPHRTRARIDHFISLYGQPLLAECMALEGTTTLGELNVELTALENYAQNLVDRRNGGESWDDLATDIEGNVENESIKWLFPFPPGYTDIWGE